MRPSKRVSAVAWLVVLVIAAGYTKQLWPEHRDPDGFRSNIGFVR
jgi:hypothetical protein